MPRRKGSADLRSAVSQTSSLLTVGRPITPETIATLPLLMPSPLGRGLGEGDFFLFYASGTPAAQIHHTHPALRPRASHIKPPLIRRKRQPRRPRRHRNRLHHPPPHRIKPQNAIPRSTRNEKRLPIPGRHQRRRRKILLSPPARQSKHQHQQCHPTFRPALRRLSLPPGKKHRKSQPPFPRLNLPSSFLHNHPHSGTQKQRRTSRPPHSTASRPPSGRPICPAESASAYQPRQAARRAALGKAIGIWLVTHNSRARRESLSRRYQYPHHSRRQKALSEMDPEIRTVS